VEHSVFCRCLRGNVTGKAMSEVINNFLNKQKSAGCGVKLYVQMA
jgi:hypothetical protein